MNDQPAREITYLEAVREAMVQEMRQDNNVFLIGEDIGVYGEAFGVSMGMLQEFGPQRVIETPIPEAAITGISVGAAMMGMRLKAAHPDKLVLADLKTSDVRAYEMGLLTRSIHPLPSMPTRIHFYTSNSGHWLQ